MIPKYEIVIYWSEIDNVFIAEVPELSGAIADGQSYVEALSNAELIISEWIETALEIGRAIPNPQGKLKIA